MAVTALKSAEQKRLSRQSGVARKAPLVLHVVYRFDTGGLENGVVNLINHMPAQAFRHAVLSLTEVTDFSRRVQREDVPFIALNKGPGHAIGLYPRMYRLFRELRPAVVHTNNIAALECVVPAWAAGVPVRIHSEHGWDLSDLNGSNPRYRQLRRLYRPFVSHYIAVSGDLNRYLLDRVGVPQQRVSHISNAVDTERFHPVAGEQPTPIDACPFSPERHWLVGTVGRLQGVKDQLNLVRAFAHALQAQPALKERMRLVIIGDGPLRPELEALVQETKLTGLVWMPGERSDVPAVMRGLHCFSLPSKAEGLSYTLLEAMASGLPVVATAVGANPDLVKNGETGEIVPPDDPQALGNALARMASAPQALARQLGRAGRARVVKDYSQQAMVKAYQGLYERYLTQRSA
ncbi:TIGR03088 family PEP-CTERM/XrtA system glycosyltransferase [Azohydromonas sp. G-1-1-14]|uniref:TIGR03088 family PEP-CTERM/XrtA system glycosyltransferase n=1 Tax=Azohydromonas caseinilytica TaxID=2728836 RepID=A0A848F6S6_9BURK|nr:TIGR03088 family PEP-CTERM/XrtA system glycosyltransferase [Azohydromonas caseinilytica]